MRARFDGVVSQGWVVSPWLSFVFLHGWGGGESDEGGGENGSKVFGGGERVNVSWNVGYG